MTPRTRDAASATVLSGWGRKFIPVGGCRIEQSPGSTVAAWYRPAGTLDMSGTVVPDVARVGRDGNKRFGQRVAARDAPMWLDVPGGFTTSALIRSQ